MSRAKERMRIAAVSDIHGNLFALDAVAAKAPAGANTYQRDNTYGGYSTNLVVNEDFLLRIPSTLRPEIAAPILCAGVTTYSPLKHWGVVAGQNVGVVGR